MDSEVHSNWEQMALDSSSNAQPPMPVALVGPPSLFMAADVAQTNRDLDFYAWLKDQTAALRTRQLKYVDWDGIAEELEAMARKESRELKSHLRNILANFLKLKYSAIRRSEWSWTGTILRERLELSAQVDDSTTLRNELPTHLKKAYKEACSLAAHEMRLDKHQAQKLFEAECPWSIDDLRNEDFSPQVAPNANGRSR
jgi:uncharacterized protein DUF29